MNDPKDVLVRATKDQITEFRESLLWKDIKRELGIWDRQFQKEYKSLIKNCIEGKENSASVLTQLGSLYGRNEAIEHFIDLPDLFLRLLEEKENDNRRDETT